MKFYFQLIYVILRWLITKCLDQRTKPINSILIKIKEQKFFIQICLLARDYWINSLYKKKLKNLKKNVISGFNLSCLGAGKEYSMYVLELVKNFQIQIVKN